MLNDPVIGYNPALRAAYRRCRRQTRERDPGVYALIGLLPAVLRPACWALWAALTSLDDLADDRNTPAAERLTQVDRWTAALERDLVAGASSDPVRHALVDAALRWQLDLSGLMGYLAQVREDSQGRHLADWGAWRTWSQGHTLPWSDQLRRLFDRAGVPLALRLDRQTQYEELLDGVRLTDTLVDLGADLAQDGLLLPQEVLDCFPGSEDGLTRRRWSSAVAALTAHLTSLARRWLSKPGLTGGMHPGHAGWLDAMVNMLLAQLDAVDRAGPALLYAAPRPSRITHARILAPARLRSAVAWSLTPITVPRTRRPPAARRLLPVAQEPHPGGMVFRAPPPHPSGAQPPCVPADRMPAHVAVIMDGNGRWAEQRGLPRGEGHGAGIRAVHEMVYGALEIGLRHLTLYSFSTENWRRDRQEVDGLLAALRDQLLADPYRELDVRLRWSGRPDRLPADLIESLKRQESATRDRTGLTLTVCVDYGGRNEITRAAASLARSARSGDVDPDQITEDDLTRHLPRPHLPDVDLLWRPGGEQRTSNFLPWQAAYAELYFTAQYWPDTDRRDLWEGITQYSRRQRRRGAAPTPSRPDVRRS
ncbi:polyprenyl diphosphate synthase [Streptomyces sp. NPDC005474]|uniref:polyprenyl diphosphate synthase n=1 Tax=Streptomyces sp. NPDC005474 TaxID=3154878 RepID=UPI0034565166